MGDVCRRPLGTAARRRAAAIAVAVCAVLVGVGGLVVPASVAHAATTPPTPVPTPPHLPGLGLPFFPSAHRPYVPLRPPNRRNHGVQRACSSAVRPGFASCNSVKQTDQDPPAPVTVTEGADGVPTPVPAGTPAATTVVVPAGYGPTDVQAAYGLTSTAGQGPVVAIIDAYDDPTAESDLATYRSTYGLPACTTAGKCFAKINQTGTASPLPAANSGWAGEISLDVDAVSAACPSCRILLVEANSTSINDLGTAVNTAVALGVKYVSNSYGTGESGYESYYDGKFYSHPGVVVTASSGDAGYGVQYPASGAGVTAVGGTSLSPATSTSRGWTETAWSGAGSGCSGTEARPAVQSALATGCAKRAEADVSAVADPQTGIAVYQTTGGTGWQVYGGTSLASPIIAAVYAQAGTPGANDTPNTYPYAGKAALNDVTSGTNGTCGPPLCTAGVGYDGPTGLGTPNGTAAFRAPVIVVPPVTTSTPRPTTTTPAAPADPIAVKYASLGGAAGFLGAAKGSPYAVGTGREQDFAGGSIFYSSATGAWEVHGSILANYRAGGGPTGPAGFPTTDETVNTDRVGRHNDFAGAPGLGAASSYWTPSLGAHTVRGLIRARWVALGALSSRLGYPTTDEYAISGGRQSAFVGGYISYYYSGGVIQVAYR